MARILLLGSTGFVGRGVAHKVLDAGHQLRVLVRDPMKAAAFKVRGAQVVVGDALDPNTVVQAASGVEHIIDLIAVRRNRPQSYLAVNVDGPRIVGEAAKAAGVRSVVLVSAIGAKLDPHLKYLTSRWMGEQELAKTGVAGTILRFSFILAEEGGILTDFERAIVGPFAIIPGSGQAKLQPILREDAARCIAEAIAKPELLGTSSSSAVPRSSATKASSTGFSTRATSRRPSSGCPCRCSRSRRPRWRRSPRTLRSRPTRST